MENRKEEIIGELAKTYCVPAGISVLEKTQKKLNKHPKDEQVTDTVDLDKAYQKTISLIIKQVDIYADVFETLKKAGLSTTELIDKIEFELDSSVTEALKHEKDKFNLYFLSVNHGQLHYTLGVQHKIAFKTLYDVSKRLTINGVEHFYKGGNTIYVDLDDSGSNAVQITKEDGRLALKLASISDNNVLIPADVLDKKQNRVLMKILQTIAEFQD